MNAVTDMLRCRHPIIPSAMGVICNPELVAAVSEAGGYGLLATAFVQDVDVLRGQIQETKKLTGNPNYKDAIVEAQETGTGLVDLGRFRIRALQTKLVEGMIQGTKDTDKGFSGQAVEASWLNGELAAGVLPAGEVSGLISSVATVRELINEMVSG